MADEHHASLAPVDGGDDRGHVLTQSNVAPVLLARGHPRQVQRLGLVSGVTERLDDTFPGLSVEPEPGNQ
jgi:hypothetical protein